MNLKEAKEIIASHGIDFNIEDAMFGDGSVRLSAKYVFDSKADAELYVESLKTIVEELTQMLDYLSEPTIIVGGSPITYL